MCSKYTVLQWDHQSPPLYATCTWRHSNELWQLRPTWKRYADDTCTILKREYSEEFTEHLNSIDPENIQWTSEGERTNAVPTSHPGETENERISNEEDQQEEIKQVRTALQLNGYPNSSTNQNHATEHAKQPTGSGSANSTSKTRSYAVQLPYVKGLTEPLLRLYKQ